MLQKSDFFVFDFYILQTVVEEHLLFYGLVLHGIFILLKVSLSHCRAFFILCDSSLLYHHYFSVRKH